MLFFVFKPYVRMCPTGVSVQCSVHPPNSFLPPRGGSRYYSCLECKRPFKDAVGAGRVAKKLIFVCELWLGDTERQLLAEGVEN